MCAVVSSNGSMADAIVVTGGSAAPKKAEIYNIKNNKWKELPDIYRARHNHSSYSINDMGYIFCGDSTTSIERLYLNHVQSGWKWIETSMELGQRKNLGSAQLNEHEIILLGGRDDRDRGVTNAVIFNFTLETTSKVDFKGRNFEKDTVIPAHFSCMRIRYNTVVTVDIETKNIVMYKHDQKTLTVLNNFVNPTINYN